MSPAPLPLAESLLSRHTLLNKTTNKILWLQALNEFHSKCRTFACSSGEEDSERCRPSRPSVARLARWLKTSLGFLVTLFCPALLHQPSVRPAVYIIHVPHRSRPGPVTTGASTVRSITPCPDIQARPALATLRAPQLIGEIKGRG